MSANWLETFLNHAPVRASPRTGVPQPAILGGVFGLIWRPLMKGIGIAAAILLAAYLADQTFSQGQYTYAMQRMILQIRHSFGI